MLIGNCMLSSAELDLKSMRKKRSAGFIGAPLEKSILIFRFYARMYLYLIMLASMDLALFNASVSISNILNDKQ